MTFIERYKAENLKCPKCGSDIIFIVGGGFDYDVEFCSNRKCDYEIEYDESTYLEDIESD